MTRQASSVAMLATMMVSGAAPATAADSAGAFVLVRQNAMLFSAPRGDSAHIRIHDFGVSELPAYLDRVTPMRLVAEERGGFVAVETPGPISRRLHCYSGLEDLEAFRVRFFVRPADLAPVTARATRLVTRELPFSAPEWRPVPRGASVTLRPGVALMDDGKGGLLAAADNLALAASAPEGTLSLSYVPTENADRCVATEVAAPGKDARPDLLHDTRAPGGTAAAPAVKRPATGWKVRAGATAFWGDGTAAGATAGDTELRMPVAKQGGRRCFRIAARTTWPIDRLPADDYFLQLCFSEKDVTPPPARPPAAPGGIAPITLARVAVEELLVGDGEEAVEGNELMLEYTGWLTDGRMFDSSKDRGPFKVILGARQVIPGWEQGLVGMRAGGVRRLTIPPSLAYGQRGFGDVIPAGSTLVFQVRLLSTGR